MPNPIRDHEVKVAESFQLKESLAEAALSDFCRVFFFFFYAIYFHKVKKINPNKS